MNRVDLCAFMLPQEHMQMLQQTLPLTFDKRQWGSPREGARLLAPLLIVTEAIEAARRAFAEGNLRAMDAIVGEYSCHLRALAFVHLAHDPEFLGELAGLAERAERVAERIRSVLASPKAVLLREPLTAEMLLLEVDPQVCGPIHTVVAGILLTIGKVWFYKESGKEVCLINLQQVQKRLHLPKEVYRSMLSEMNALAQSRIARFSIGFIREIAGEYFSPQHLVSRQLEEGALVDLSSAVRHEGELPCSATFFNCMALIADLKARRTLVLLGENPTSVREQRPLEGRLILYDRRRESWEAVARADVQADEPLCLFEGFLPHGVKNLLNEIAEVGGFEEAVRINAASADQFGMAQFDERVVDLEARDELGKYRMRAAALGCVLRISAANGRRFWTISHIAASTLAAEEARGVRIVDVLGGAGPA